MTTSEKLSTLSGVIFALGYVPYIRAVWRDRHLPTRTPGKKEPSVASWIIWLVLDVTTIISLLIKHAMVGQMLGAFVGSIVVVYLAWRYGTRTLELSDKICLALVGVSLLLGTFLDLTWTIAINSIATLIGSVPTYKSVWKDYRREEPLAWILYTASCIPALCAIPAWTFKDTVQPFVYTGGSLIVLYLLFIRRGLPKAFDRLTGPSR